jgi:uncharacterized membrane protein YfcA
METLTPLAWTLALGIALAGGVVKGTVGFALPLILISGLSTFLDPRLALAGLLIPTVASNLWQVTRQGGPAMAEAARLHWRYLAILVVAIALSAQVAAVLPRQAFYLILGIPVVALSAIQLAGLRLRVPAGRERPAEWGAGLISGLLGGLAGTWGPTTVLYLLAIDTPKARQMVVQGVIYGTGSVVLLGAHLRSGILNAETAVFSAGLLPAVLAGMWLGFRLQDRLDAARFKTVTLVVLTVAGLNLIRRGIFG